MDHPPVVLNFVIVGASAWYAAKIVRNGWYLFLIVPALCAGAVAIALIADLIFKWESTEKAFDTAVVNAIIAALIGTVAAVRVRLMMLVARLRVDRWVRQTGARDVIVIPTTALQDRNKRRE